MIIKNQKVYLFILFLFMVHLGFSQNYTLNGYIRDATNGETLIGATVVLQSDKTKGAVTNPYGFYSMTMQSGTYDIIVTYVGFKQRTINVDLSSNKTLDIELEPEDTQLEEIEITAVKEDQNVTQLEMSVNKLDIKIVDKMPKLLGETEIIRSIQLLPGVNSVGEGAAGFNVRGGSIDQNLVILDEAPVFNSSHLFGFFSVFNPDAVKDVKLYKGGIPARYGGRLASILDVRMKEGNSKQFEMNGGIGTIFSRLAIEAPIVKDKASFIIAGRRSYIDVLAKPFLSEDFENSILNFYDLTLKANYKINNNNQLFVSGYLGRDNIGFGDQASFSWGNTTTTARWNHLFNDRLFSNFTFYYSDYDYQINFGDTAEDSFDWSAKIRNTSFKPEFSYYINPSNSLLFGGQIINYEIQPANAIAASDGERIDISLEFQKAIESAIFAEQEITLNDLLTVNYGLRLSYFNYRGKRDAYFYGEPEFLGARKPVDEVKSFGKGKTIEDYMNLEPRLSLKFQLEKSSIKASYNRTTQYIHLLSNTTASIPVDIWTPSTNNIKPQIADQVALGYFRNFKNNAYEFSAETYYKTSQNTIDYIEGANLTLNRYVEGEILSGKSRAYGLELLMKKNKGRFTGWLSYALARGERKIDGINNGGWYPNRFDQTHTFSFTGFYELSKRCSFSTAFVFNSGAPISLPSSKYEQQGYVIPNNDSGLRNQIRLPSYHRLDIALIIGPKERNKNRRWKGEWSIGVYNLYNRKNPFSIYSDQETAVNRQGQTQNPRTFATQLAVIGSLIPSISYNFTFK